MAGERYRHIFLPGPNQTQPFTNPRRGGEPPRIPHRDPAGHGFYLMRRLESAWREDKERRAVAHPGRNGVYIDFVSEPGFDLIIKSLESLQSGIRLLNVRREGKKDAERTFATVFVPNSKRGYFLKKIHDFSEQVTQRGKPKNGDLVSSISDIRRSVLESFWVDSRELLPGDSPSWVEVWLSGDSDEIRSRFNALLQRRQIERSEGEVIFPERAVIVILADRAQLEFLIETSDDIAEFRLAKEVATFFIEMENQEQTEWVKELLDRTRYKFDRDIAVTILDTGVNNGHALLEPVLADPDLHAAHPTWKTHDDGGHGTLMAGSAAYGDLITILNSTGRVTITHRLESVKILPPPPTKNPKKLWGYMTAQGVYRAEIQAPTRMRVVCLAVTSTDDRDRGRPSSWSAEIDGLSSGYEDGVRRLFILSAGNTKDYDEFRAYPDSNITNQVHDPGQSWNALTVGAFTEKVRITDSKLQGFTPIAPAGGLSPFSTTSTTWEARKWPLKPDVVFEGGNVARGPNDSIIDTEDLKLLSTFHDPHIAQFAPFCATSAAAAQAAWMAAVIQSRYPEMWPETLRGLIVHTAEWTKTMREQFLPRPPSLPSKAHYSNLLRICGYGAPSLERALYCAANSLTLVGQSELQPFGQRGGRRVTQDMHLYSLPWPMEILRDLGEIEVDMRVTLSYFVEPGPGEVGWQDRYRYASHALRFAVNGPGESEREFIRRINNQARDNGEHPGTEGPGDRWLIGDTTRNVGSVHSDIWRGRAVDLASSNLIGIYPAVGWWRERHHLGRANKRTRYSLLVSIHTPPLNVDIYTPVAVKVGIAVPIAVPIEN